MELKKSPQANLEKKKGLFIQIGLTVVLALVLIAFEWTSQPELVNVLGEEAALDIEEEIIPVTRQLELQPPPPPPPPQVLEIINIVEDDTDIEDEIQIEDDETSMDEEIDIVKYEEVDEVAEEEVFIIVEDMPKFQGGDYNTFRVYITQNLKYPTIAAENGISGRVFVQFAVNSAGKVVDAKVVRGVHDALDKEALRVVESSPAWSPGKQRGKPVKVQFTFPIVFMLQ